MNAEISLPLLARAAAGQLELIPAPEFPAPDPQPVPGPRPGTGTGRPVVPDPDMPPRRTNSRPGSRRRPGRTGAARWWFARMREAVRTARDWPVAEEPVGATEQIALPLTTPPTRFERREPSDTLLAA